MLSHAGLGASAGQSSADGMILSRRTPCKRRCWACFTFLARVTFVRVPDLLGTPCGLNTGTH